MHFKLLVGWYVILPKKIWKYFVWLKLIFIHENYKNFTYLLNYMNNCIKMFSNKVILAIPWITATIVSSQTVSTRQCSIYVWFCTNKILERWVLMTLPNDTGCCVKWTLYFYRAFLCFIDFRIRNTLSLVGEILEKNQQPTWLKKVISFTVLYYYRTVFNSFVSDIWRSDLY